MWVSTSGGTRPASDSPRRRRSRTLVDETSGVAAWSRKINVAPSVRAGAPAGRMRVTQIGQPRRQRVDIVARP